MKAITWGWGGGMRGGFVCGDNHWFCVEYRLGTSGGDHKEQTSDEHRDNKSPLHSYPICVDTNPPPQKKRTTMEDESAPIAASNQIILNIQLYVRNITPSTLTVSLSLSLVL